MKRPTIRRYMLAIAALACLFALYRCTYVVARGPIRGVFVKLVHSASESGCLSIYHSDGTCHPRGLFFSVYRDIRRNEIPWAIGHISGHGFIYQHYRRSTWGPHETRRGP